MNRLFITCFFGLLFLFPAFSQSSVWKIEGEGSILYLGGSIHLLREQDYPLPAAYDSAYSQSDILVFETNINPADMVTIRSKILGMTLYPRNKSLKTELRSDVYDKLDSAFQSSGLKLEQMNGLKPVMAILTLTGIEWQKMGLGTEGVDMHFYKKASHEQKEMLFLEEVDDQVRLITQMGEGTENDFVLMSLKDLKESRERTEELIQSWKEGNQIILNNQLEEFRTMFPEVYQTLLTDRNNNWMVHLNDFMATPETEFVVVGNMHLYGPDGLLTKLQEKGFVTKQLQ